ncbi:MAG TPA: hypothetical protein VGI75_09280 [Pirellulales bacterium]
MATRKTYRTLAFQPLEDRKLMTATPLGKLPAPKVIVPNVTTSVSSKHVLSVTGDTNSDAISITQTAANEFTVTGLNGTTIDGTHTTLNFTGVTGDVDVTFKGGSATTATLNIGVNSGITFANNLNVNMGNGTNSFNMFDATVKGSMMLNGGTGHDFAEISYSTIGNAAVNGGANDLTINLGGGQNGLVLERFVSVERDLNVLDPSGTGGDAITLTENVTAGRYIYMVTGSGNDTVSLSGVNAGSQLNIQTGAGNDNVTLGGKGLDNDVGAVGADSVSLDLGAGNDQLTFGADNGGGVFVRHGATYNGGTGIDSYYNDAVLAQTGSFTGFEFHNGLPW